MTLKAIKKIVEQFTGVADLSIKTKQQPIPFARWLYFYMSHRYTSHTLKEIGDEVKKDHATVLNGLKMIKIQLSTGQFHYKKQYYEVDDFIATHRGDKEHISIEHTTEYYELWRNIA